MIFRHPAGRGDNERRRLAAPPSFAFGAFPVSVLRVAVPSATLVFALLLLFFAAPGVSFAAGPHDEGWLDLGHAGRGAGCDTIVASCDEATSLRLTCERGSGKIRLIWIWNGPARSQIGQNRRMEPGDVYIQPIRPQGVTSVQLFDEGDGVYRVELFREKRP